MLRNRPEFHVLDMAALFCGGTPVSIYNSSSPEQIQYLVDHCEATIAIADDATFLARFLEVRDQLPRLQHVGVLGTGFAQHRGLNAIAHHTAQIQALFEQPEACWVLVDDGDVVLLGNQAFSDAFAHTAGAQNDDVHGAR